MKRSRSIKTNLIALIAAFVFLPLFVTVAVLGAVYSSASNSQLIQANELMVSQVAAKVDLIMETLNYTSSSILRNSSDRRALYRYYNPKDEYTYYASLTHLTERLNYMDSSILNSFSGESAILTTDGRLISTRNGRLGLTGYEELAWYRAILERGTVPYWDYRIGEAFPSVSALNSYDMGFGRGIYSYQGELLGVVLIRLPGDTLWSRLHHDSLYDGRLSILSADGRVLSTNRSDDPELIPSYFPAGHPVWECGTGQTLSGRSEDRFYVAYGLETTGYVLLYTASYDRIFAQTNQMSSLLLLTLAAIFCIILGLVLYVSNRISRPIRGLIDDMDSLQDGNLAVREQRSFLEIEQLTHQFNHALQRISLLIGQVREESRLKEKAYFEALQAQINPHFLFNTLNTIRWTAHINGDTKVSGLLSDLGVMLSATYDTESELVTASEELRLLDSYVKIMRARYGNNFLYDKEIPEELSGCLIPKFSLQPLVENAILHGISKMPSGRLLVSAQRQGGDVLFAVSDNGAGVPKEKLDTLLIPKNEQKGRLTGIGLGNVHQRLQMMFGSGYGLDVDHQADEGFSIELRIPYRTRSD